MTSEWAVECVAKLLDAQPNYAWVTKSSAFQTTLFQTDPNPSECLCVSNRPTHEIVPGTLFLDAQGRGMVLIVPFGSLREERHLPTHELVLAFTHPMHRKQGVLRALMHAVPSSWHLWFEANKTNAMKHIWTSLGCTRRSGRPIRCLSVDWDETAEMERLPALYTNALAFHQPRVVVV